MATDADFMQPVSHIHHLPLSTYSYNGLPDSAENDNELINTFDSDSQKSTSIYHPEQTTHLIILSEMAERCCYYGLVGSLPLFLTRELRLQTSVADVYVGAWSGLCYATPLIGGYLADSVFGRYKTILIFSFIYLAGQCIVTLMAVPGITSPMLFWCGMVLVALGTGGIKSNVSTLGAEQFPPNNLATTEQRASKETFFNSFYMSINVGALFSYTVVSYTCQNVSFSLGYLMTTIAMAAALIFFMFGRRKYVRIPPTGSMLAKSAWVVFEAIKSYIKPTRRSTVPENYSFIDAAKFSSGAHYSNEDVDALKDVLALGPFLLVFVLYWMVYLQMNTTFFNQGCAMDLRLPLVNMDIPISALNMFDTLAIIVLIPVFDRAVFPFLRRYGFVCTTLQKIGAGFLCSAMAMAVIAVIENVRMQYVAESSFVGSSVCYAEGEVQAVSMSVLWQVPAFMLIGAGEVLASATALDFFFSEAPESMRSVVSALSLSTTAVGSVMTALLILAVNSFGSKPWLADNPNSSQLARYFWLLCILMLLNTSLFVLFAMRHTYRNDRLAIAGNLPIASLDKIAPSSVRLSTNGARDDDDDDDNIYNSDQTGLLKAEIELEAL